MLLLQGPGLFLLSTIGQSNVEDGALKLVPTIATIKYPDLAPGAGQGTANSINGDDQNGKEFSVQKELKHARQLRAQQNVESSYQAVGKYKEALKQFQDAHNRRAAAEVLKELGQLYDSLDDSGNALAAFKQAIGLSKDLKDKAGEIELLNEVGQLLVDLGQPDTAIKYASSALRLAESTDDTKDIAWASNTIGDAHYNLGDLKKSLEHYQRAYDLSVKLNDGVGQIRALVSFGYAYVDLSESSKAFEAYDRALTRSKLDNLPHWEAITLRALGNLQTKVGENQNAIDLFLKALKILESVHDRHLQATVLAGLGYAYEGIGEKERALEYYNEALAMFQVINHVWGESETRMDVGRVYQSLGDHQQAMSSYTRALLLFQELKMPRYQAQTLRDMGLLCYSLGDTRKALESYRRSLKLTRAGQDQRYEAYTLNYIGMAYQKAGETKKAIQYFHQALQLNRLASDPAGESLTLANVARAARDLNNLKEASQYIEAALEISESLRTKVSSQNSRAIYFASVRQQFDLYIDILMKQDKINPGRFGAEAFGVSERARSRSLLEMLDEAHAGIRQGVDPDLIERERTLRQWMLDKSERRMQMIAQKRNDEATALSRDLSRLNTEYDQLQAQIKVSSPRYAALTQPQPLTLKEVQQQVLSNDSLLLEFALGDERSYVWAVTRTEALAYELPNRVEIERQARDVYNSLVANQLQADETIEERQVRVAVANDLSSRISVLSNTLLGPVAAKLEASTLLIVPDGALQYIPFQVLHNPVANRPLLLDHEIVNEPSASALGLIVTEARGRKVGINSIAVLADPVFESDDPRIASGSKSAMTNRGSETELHRALRDVNLTAVENRIPRLLASRDEAEAIMSFAPWGSGFKATGFEASRATAMKAELAEYRIVHFATHGLLNNEHPELSGIVLSLVDEQGQPQDGFLRLHDIYNLNLPVDLVVLSACNTGLGKDVKSEGLIGLTRGFMYAGASSVVASLWKVDDEATAELMKRFYGAMLQEGLSPAAALRKAQLEMSKQKRWQSPYYWSGFIIQGQYIQTPRPTHFSTSKLTIVGGMVVILMLTLFLIWKRRRPNRL